MTQRFSVVACNCSDTSWLANLELPSSPPVLTFSGALGALSILVCFPRVDEVAVGFFLGLLAGGKRSSNCPDMFLVGSLFRCPTVSNDTVQTPWGTTLLGDVRAFSVTPGVVAMETVEDWFRCFNKIILGCGPRI